MSPALHEKCASRPCAIVALTPHPRNNIPALFTAFSFRCEDVPGVTCQCEYSGLSSGCQGTRAYSTSTDVLPETISGGVCGPGIARCPAGECMCRIRNACVCARAFAHVHERFVFAYVLLYAPGMRPHTRNDVCLRMYTNVLLLHYICTRRDVYLHAHKRDTVVRVHVYRPACPRSSWLACANNPKTKHPYRKHGCPTDLIDASWRLVKHLC